MKPSLWIWSLLGCVAAGVTVDWRSTTVLTRDIVTAEARVAALRRTADAAAQGTAEQRRLERVAEEKWDVVAAEMAVEQKYGPAPAKVWRARIKALQDAMAQSPGERVPELSLLELKDWIDAAIRAQGASARDLRKVFAALRQTARVRAAQKIQDALKRFLDASGGVLPADLRQLRPLLPADVTPEMLAPYHLTKTGAPAKSDDRVIEATFGTIRLSISPTGWNSNATSSADNFEEGEAMLSGLGGEGRREELVAWQAQLVRAIQQVGPMMEHAFPDATMEAVGPQLKAAVQQYIAAHQGEPPRSVADLQSLVPASATLAQGLRPVVANLEYAFEHDGQLPTDPNRLRRYLDALDDTQLLRRMRLTMKDGGHFDVSFDLSY